jgi:ornithine lipid ester-linked acyl 2-hydroxylase
MTAPAFHPAAAFAFTAALEAHWETIRDEFRAVRDRSIEYVERDLYDKGWKVFIMANFPHREPVVGNDLLCPFTVELVRRHVPRLGVLCFSIMDSGTVIAPHEGRAGEYLRCHLGLEVPEGDCCLAVGEQTRHWENGKTLVFDDRHRHGAWNRTAEPRAILLFDFIP